MVQQRGLTRHFSFERAADDVLWSSIFDGDEVAAGSHGRVRDLVALRTLLAVHLHLRGPVDGDGQGTGSSVACVHDEVGGHTCRRGWRETISLSDNGGTKSRCFLLLINCSII